MSHLPARRVCLTIQRRAARSSPLLARSYASHTHDDHHGHHGAEPHPWTYRKETLTSRPFLIAGAVFVGVVGLNQFGFFKASDEHPITKYIASTIPSREQILRENLDRIEIVKERAATYRLSKNAQQDTFKPYRNPGSLAAGSPHGLGVEPQVDVAGIKSERPHRE